MTKQTEKVDWVVQRAIDGEWVDWALFLEREFERLDKSFKNNQSIFPEERFRKIKRTTKTTIEELPVS